MNNSFSLGQSVKVTILNPANQEETIGVIIGKASYGVSARYTVLYDQAHDKKAYVSVPASSLKAIE